jgi:ParB family transcriptional regulator, chromosome partitioning protein
MATDIRSIPLSSLVLSPINARQTRSKEAVEAMAASLVAHGQLQNLVVHELDASKFGVAIGGTRLEALQLLAKQKKIGADHPITVEVSTEAGPVLAERSLAENTIRTRMSAADEFTAFSALASEGHGAAEIGARFGQTGRYVEQRMKLAAVSPKLLAVFRKGEMDLDQLEAFTLSSSHKQQEKVWRELPEFVRRNGHTEQIRAALTEQHIEADEPLVRFVGLDAYRKAGGNVMQDLFDLDNPEAGYLTDSAILNRLAGEKLETVAEPIKTEGWKWVDVNPAYGWQDEQKMGRVTASLTKEQRTEIAQLEKQQEKLVEDQADEQGDLPEKADQKYAELERQIAAIRKEAGFTLAQKANAGVVITIGHHDGVEIKRGLVKPEDKRAVAKAEATDKPAKGSKAEEAEKPEPGMSAALIENLTAHRTAALQAKLATNPKVALVAITHALALSVLDRSGYSVLGITGTTPRLEANAGDGIAKTPAAKEFAAATREATKGMPRESGKLWTWLMQQDQRRLLSILAVAAAHTVNAVEKKFNGADRTSADQFAEAVKLDMSVFWQAGAENFFSRVSKEQTLAAVTEAAGAEVAKGMAGMKKAELAVAAEKAIKGKGWIPTVLANG